MATRMVGVAVGFVLAAARVLVAQQAGAPAAREVTILQPPGAAEFCRIDWSP